MAAVRIQKLTNRSESGIFWSKILAGYIKTELDHNKTLGLGLPYGS